MKIEEVEQEYKTTTTSSVLASVLEQEAEVEHFWNLRPTPLCSSGLWLLFFWSMSQSKQLLVFVG
ncbi:hypothetical protein Hanom_Chr05g00412521 [Helianthus anomalus]